MLIVDLQTITNQLTHAPPGLLIHYASRN